MEGPRNILLYLLLICKEVSLFVELVVLVFNHVVSSFSSLVIKGSKSLLCH